MAIELCRRPGLYEIWPALWHRSADRIVISLLVGLVIGTVTLKLKNDYFALATYGFSEVIKNVLIYFSSFTGGSMGVFGIPASVTLPLVAVIFLVGLVITRNFKVTKLGRNSLAIRNDELAAQVMGINVFKHKLSVFLLSAVFGSVAGSLLAFATYYIEPNLFDWNRSISLIVIVFFGGINSLTGAVTAGSPSPCCRKFCTLVRNGAW